jgi:hypothetical protein
MPESTAFSLDGRLPRKQAGLVALVAIAAAGLYLLAASRAVGLGFPLDDSWIHLAYARNLAELGQWAFLPGQPSAGSTAPLWTVLLAPGFLLKLGPYAWTYALGIACLVGLGLVTERIVRRQVPAYRPPLPWAGLLMVTEWHFVWAAVSGMETLLYTLLAIIILGMIMQGSRNFVGQGVLIGLSVWLRPDGLTLLAPALIAALLIGAPAHQRVKALLMLLGGFAAVVLPYLLVNLAISGTPFPNTFYAKQAEYMYWRISPLPTKLENLSLVFFGGLALLLLPAVVGATLQAVRLKSWGTLLALAWGVGYAWLYASRLPVYQHGRYIMPAMAAYLLVGLVFLAEWLPSAASRLTRLLRFAWLAAIVIISGVFYVYGATVYARDVSMIERKLVASAKWVAQNVPSGQLIAVHDIGALGYFAPQTRLLDLAGLVSPEVVPFITDEAKLAAYISASGAEYIIILPRHYPELAKMGSPVFIASHPDDATPADSVVVYRWEGR